MAPFSFLIDDYWVQSDGSRLLANTQEETAAKTAFLSGCSLNFRLTSCWQTQTLHGWVLQCPSPSFLCSVSETLWNLQSQHRNLKKGNILLLEMCAISGALWFQLNSKWIQCCFFSFMPLPSSKMAWPLSSIISDMRGLFSPLFCPILLMWPGLH